MGLISSSPAGEQGELMDSTILFGFLLIINGLAPFNARSGVKGKKMNLELFNGAAFSMNTLMSETSGTDTERWRTPGPTQRHGPS